MKITELWFYPVKSLQGISVETLSFDALGPCSDRRYMLVDEQGQFFSQRQCAALSQVQVSLAGDDISAGFNVQVGQHPAIFLATQGITEEADLIDVSIWSDTLQAFWQHHALEAVLSELAGQSLRLVYIAANNSEHQRYINEKYVNNSANKLLGFADGFPSLICWQASFNAVKTRAQQLLLEGSISNNTDDKTLLLSDLQHFNIQCYRPNIVLAADSLDPLIWQQAFIEDSYTAIENEVLRFDLVKPCARCVVPTINPKNAKKQPVIWQALKALNSQQGELIFGQNALHDFTDAESCSVSIGDCFSFV